MKPFLSVLCLLASIAHAKPPEDWTWILGRATEPTANLVADAKFVELLEKHGPRLKVDLGLNVRKKKNSAMEAAVLEAMTGETEPIQILTPQTLVLTGCRLTNCDEKGFIWIDIEQRKVVMALIHYVFQGVRSTSPMVMYSARAVPCAKISPAAVEAIKVWVKSKNITPEAFRCADR